MKAVVQYEYGSLDLLEVKEVPRPRPGDDEVLVRLRAAAVTLSDTITRKGRPLVGRFFTGLLRPRQQIQGSEFAGEIEAVGRDVTRFKVGDEVFGVTGSDCGCFAELMCMPADGLLGIKPANTTFEEAASVCGALAAWNFLRDKADVQVGQEVLVNGAPGAIGTAAVQLAKDLGARVTAVCGTSEVELVESLGADKVIDDTREDFTKKRRGLRRDLRRREHQFVPALPGLVGRGWRISQNFPGAGDPPPDAVDITIRSQESNRLGDRSHADCESPRLSR